MAVDETSVSIGAKYIARNRMGDFRTNERTNERREDNIVRT